MAKHVRPVIKICYDKLHGQWTLNFNLSSNNLQITGQSCPLSFKGSPYWMAPEVSFVLFQTLKTRNKAVLTLFGKKKLYRLSKIQMDVILLLIYGALGARFWRWSRLNRLGVSTREWVNLEYIWHWKLRILTMLLYSFLTRPLCKFYSFDFCKGCCDVQDRK